MSIFVVFFAIFATVFAQGGQHDQHNHEMHRVNVAVYYESLCPDSIKFFTKQLYPSLQNANISQYINLTLVPYGKSTMKSENGVYTFECHHGENECKGNKLQACVLKYIDNGKNSEGLGYNKITTAFINCLMDKVDTKNPNFPTAECAKNSKAEATVEGIENCQKNTEASTLLAELGKMTEKLNPPLKSVPTVVFNNQQKEADSKMANENFVKALCQYIQAPKPAECTSSSATIFQISFFAFLLAATSYLL